MLIVIDGHPGAGKTTLVNRLAASGVTVIAEVVDSDGRVVVDYGRDVRSPEETLANMPMVLDSDLTKHRLARWLSKSGTVVMDRNYVFTMGVSLTLGMIMREEVFYAASRWFSRNRAELVIPDAYIVLDLPAELSDERIGWRPRTPGNPMTFVELRRTAAAYCDAFRRVREPHCPVHHLDATRSVEATVRGALSIISEHNHPGARPLRGRIDP